MTDMIERVARAALERLKTAGSDPDLQPLVSGDIHEVLIDGTVNWVDVTRATIEAMRIPKPDPPVMEISGCTINNTNDGYGVHLVNPALQQRELTQDEENWNNRINAILAGAAL